MKLIALLLPTLFLVSCGQAPDLNSEKGKFSYAVGYEIARNMKKEDVEIHYGSFLTAMKDVMESEKNDETNIKMTAEERRNAMSAVADIKRKAKKEKVVANKAKNKKFLDENKKKPGVKTTASGLQYMVLTSGKGKKPRAIDKVRVHYKGSLLDGTEFDSSYKRKKPAEFPLKAVIPGWTEALQLMREGSKYKIFIPPALGYGDRSNSNIPGGSALIFEVELLEVLGSKKSKKKSKKKNKKK